MIVELDHPVRYELLEYDEIKNTEETKVPDHYEKVADGECWIKIYDDESLTLELNAHSIEVYRAGSLGCLIRLSK